MRATLKSLNALPKRLFWSTRLGIDSDFTAEDPLAFDYLGQPSLLTVETSDLSIAVLQFCRRLARLITTIALTQLGLSASRSYL